MNRRENNIQGPSRVPTKDITKEETEPKQLKAIPTPRIKLKHNDITDEEFSLLMEHQRRLQYVRIYTLQICCIH